MSLYKPSPLSFGSPRASPFRRPESPASPSTNTINTLRPTTPTTSPTKPFSSSTKPHTPLTSPTKLSTTTTSPLPAPSSSTWSTPRTGLAPRREPAPSPTRTPNHGSSTTTPTHFMATATNTPHRALPLLPIHDPLSKLPAPRVREMREAFEILDCDNDGYVSRDDVAAMLTSLGLLESTHPFFPTTSTPHPLPLPTYLSQLSTLLTPLSPPAELLAAFAAFDDDDSGQIDVPELRDALIQHQQREPVRVGMGESERALSVAEIEMVLGEFSGKRAFGGGGAGAGGKGAGLAAASRGRGDVFRYREFVGSVMGAGGEGGKGKVG